MLNPMTRIEQEAEIFGRRIHGAYTSCGKVRETFAQEAGVSHELVHEVVHGRAHLISTEELMAINKGLESMGVDSRELLLLCLMAGRFCVTPSSALVIQERVEGIVRARRVLNEDLIEQIRQFRNAGFTHSELLLVHRAVQHARPVKAIPRRRRQVSYN